MFGWPSLVVLFFMAAVLGFRLGVLRLRLAVQCLAEAHHELLYRQLQAVQQWEQTGVRRSESQPGWMQQCQYYYPEHADTVISGVLRARMAPTGRRIDEFVCAVWQSGAIASPWRGGGFSGVLSRPGAAAFVLKAHSVRH